MDPKNPNQLDPKLKEAYDRVMSTTIAPNQTPPAAPAASATPAAPTAPVTPVPAVPASNAASATPAVPAAPMQTTTEELHRTTTFVATDPKTLAGPIGVATKKKGAGVSPILLVLLGVVFFAVYTLVWFNVFNVPIPYISTPK